MNQDWQFVAARLFLFDLYKEAAITRRYKSIRLWQLPKSCTHACRREKIR